jgi:hypothetical protein
MIYLRHLRPLSSHLTGKWSVSLDACYFYTLIEGKIRELSINNEIKKLLFDITVAQSEVKGLYDRRTDSIIYTVDPATHNLVIEEVTNMTNVYWLRKI